MIINPYLFGSVPLLLDTYPNAAVAYSLRKLRTAYTGAAIRVRRSSDNAEQDIGFNDFNNTLIDWVGYNLWAFSEEWDNAAWTRSGLNTTGTPPYINVAVAPDGTTTADKITENIISGAHLTFRQLLVTTGVTYNVSVYLKHGGRNARVESPLSNLATYTVDVNLLTGTLSNNTFPITPILQDVGNGWYRLSYQVTATNIQTRNVITINLLNPSGIPSPVNYPGDGVSGVFIWGAQATATSLVRKYTKTVATANNGDAFITTWYDQSGNANNSTQATAANQAQIVSSGAIITDPITGKISATWTGDNYTISNVAVTQNMLMSAVVNRTATNNTLFIFGSTSTTPSLYAWGNTGNATTRIFTETVTHESGNTTTGAYIMSALRDSSNIAKAWRNTTALTTGLASGGIGTANFTRFGAALATAMTARCVEAIFWNNDKESSRADIVTNQNDYWEVY